MGGVQKKVNLDRQALKAYLDDHKIVASKLSLEMGWAYNYLNECLRDNKPKNMQLASYKYLCATLKVPEETFILKEKAKEPPKETPQQPPQPQQITVNGGITPGQFNALLQAIQGLTTALTEGLAKIVTTEGSNAIIQGKIYGEVQALSAALGVNEKKTTTPSPAATPIKPISVKPQYANSVGGK